MGEEQPNCATSHRSYTMVTLSTATRPKVVNSASARSLPSKYFKADWGFKMCYSSSFEEAQRNRQRLGP